MKSIILRLSLVFAGAILFSGCSIFPKNPNIAVNYFDIGSPQKIKDADKINSIKIEDFKSTNPYNERMVFRTSQTHIEVDEYNRWVCPPEDMLKKYFLLALNAEDLNKFKLPKNDNLRLFVTVICLEADLSKNTVKLSLLVQVRKADSGGELYFEMLTEEEKVNKVTAESFAGTVKVLTDRMITRILNDVSKISKPQYQT